MIEPTPRIPHKPEPVAQLRARFEAALVRVFQPQDLARCNPESLAEHRFDFDDGTRMFVTRDEHARGVVKIHASISAFTPGPIRLRPNPKKALRHYWRLLTNRAYVPDGDGEVVSSAGYPHVWMDDAVAGQPAGGGGS